MIPPSKNTFSCVGRQFFRISLLPMLFRQEHIRCASSPYFFDVSTFTTFCQLESCFLEPVT